MDALWEIEEKWKLSTQQAFLLLVSAGFAIIGVCMAMTVLRKKAQRKQHQQLVVMGQEDTNGALGHKRLEPSCGWGSIKRALVDSVRWSKASKWGEIRRGGSWRETTPTGPLLEKRIGVEMGWHSHNSESPVWQRPILMGEKCELPRFSGLILYDERGQPLCDSHQETGIQA
ncbi:uncharacterized protein LOC126787024 [Argentina anserina]|uniref:uncharacterized protein LOC126787024 n=1 Tax=Argentina anserina TaxID=57926 RepID=UPI0021763391|nr:uncharacterized protein LOC126787024 [Potentilla anserina]